MGTINCTSYDTSRTVGALMEHLKEKGLGPTERAIVFRDHMALCFVEVGGMDDPHGVCNTPIARFKREYSKRVQDLHWNIAGNEDLERYGDLHKAMEKSFDEIANNVFGTGKDDFTRKGKLIRALVDNDNTESSLNMEGWIDIGAGGARKDWDAIRDMEMDEDDLAHQIERKSPFHAQDNPGTKVRSLDKGFRILQEAAKNAHVPQVVMDVITGTTPQEFGALAKGIRQANEGFMRVGAPSLGVDRVGLYVAPFLDGTGGVMMQAEYGTDSINEMAVPRVGLSNRCGWGYEEVIIHEYLHAHDAMLGQVEQELDIERGRHLLSDQLESLSIKQKPSGLMEAWMTLLNGVTHVQQYPMRARDLYLAEAALGQRWASLGVDPQALNQAAQDWRESQDESRDAVLGTAIKELFTGTPFEKTSGFRSEVIAAEVKILDLARSRKDHGGTPVFKQFLDQFDSMLSDDGARHYGKGYFEDTAERMARAMQGTLDNSGQQDENPYSKRWLVYADTNQSGAIADHFKAFFENPHVKKAYGDLAAAPSDMLTETRRTRIQIESKDWFGPEYSGKAPTVRSP